LALVEGCRHALEVSIPAAEVETETTRVAADVQKRAKLPGFRPGKAPSSLIRKQFAGDIRQQVLENLIPKTLQKQFEAENLNVVGTPDISDVHFHQGEPLTFRAEFEVVPSIELGEYRGIEVAYTDPEVASVGLGEDAAKARSIPVNVGRFNFSINGRALANGSSDGFAKIVADAATDRILGAQILGRGAGELIAEVVAHMAYGGSAEDLGRTIHAHPTLSEALKEAGLAVSKSAIHAI